MDELPFYKAKSEEKFNPIITGNDEKDLRSPGNITALLAIPKINNSKALAYQCNNASRG